MSFSIAEYFDEKGIFAKHRSDYHRRDAQVELAQAIQEAIDSNGVLIAEAGTGTGKTWAYLIPAFLNQRKTIISTGTKILQNQLYRKDVPEIRKLLNLPVRTVLLKGRSNYLCHYYLERLDQDDRPLRSRDEVQQLQSIKIFAKKTHAGDKADCDLVDESAPIWARVTSTTENCLGKDCPFVDDCFVLKARKQAMEADIVVVNHALYMADYSLRQQGFGELLPKADVVIFDEAHQLPDVATQFMGSMVSTYQFSDWHKEARLALHSHASDATHLWENELKQTQQALRELNLHCIFLEKEPSFRSTWDSLAEPDELRSRIDYFLKTMRTLLLIMQQMDKRHVDIAAAARLGAQLYESLRDWLPAKPQANIAKQDNDEGDNAQQVSTDEAEELIHDLAKPEDPLQPLVEESVVEDAIPKAKSLMAKLLDAASSGRYVTETDEESFAADTTDNEASNERSADKHGATAGLRAQPTDTGEQSASGSVSAAELKARQKKSAAAASQTSNSNKQLAQPQAHGQKRADSDEESGSQQQSARSGDNTADELQTENKKTDAQKDHSAGFVRWLELSTNQQHVRFSKAPLSVERFGNFKTPEQSWVFTSATLSVNNDPKYFSNNLGLYDHTYRHWESPFDYQNNALLYVPDHLPLPSAPGFNEAFARTLWPLIKECSGGVLVLCTSLRSVEQVAELLKGYMTQEAAKQPDLQRPILVQGHRSKPSLVADFKESGRAVLVGSSTFWEGVDFPGNLLTLVAIDKLPFMHPDDPVLEARIKECNDRGGNPFMQLQIPHAAITLKQGAGRLIRTQHDRGLLMIADKRLVESRYGQLLWGGLPPFVRTRHYQNALGFIRQVSEKK